LCAHGVWVGNCSGWSRGPKQPGRQAEQRAHEGKHGAEAKAGRCGRAMRSTTQRCQHQGEKCQRPTEEEEEAPHEKDQHHFHKMTAGRRHPKQKPLAAGWRHRKAEEAAHLGLDHSWVESPVFTRRGAISLRPFPRAQQDCAPTTEKRASMWPSTNRLCSQITTAGHFPIDPATSTAMFSRSTGWTLICWVFPVDGLVDRQPMQPDRVNRLEFDGEVDSREEELVLERFEIRQQRQDGCHGLSRAMVVRLVVAEMQTALLVQKRPRDFENEDHDPGIRRCDLNRGIGDHPAREQKSLGAKSREPRCNLAPVIAAKSSRLSADLGTKTA